MHDLSKPASVASGLQKDWRRALWRDLPLWFIPAQVLYLSYVETTVLAPPRLDLLLAGLAPLAWFAAVLIVRIRLKKSSLMFSRRISRRSMAAAAAIAIPFAFPPLTRDPGIVKTLFEVNLLAGATIMGLHCFKTRGLQDLLCVFGIGFLYGLLLENSGIWMGFFSESGYFAYIPGLPAPLTTMCGWSLSFYVAVWIADQLAPQSSRIVFTLLATGFILSLDIGTDPAAIVFHWWSWPESFSHRLLDVPLINFIAWISATVPFFFAYAQARSSKWPVGWNRSARLAALMPAVLVVAALMVLGLTWFALGFDSPEMRLFRSALISIRQFLFGAGA